MGTIFFIQGCQWADGLFSTYVWPPCLAGCVTSALAVRHPALTRSNRRYLRHAARATITATGAALRPSHPTSDYAECGGAPWDIGPVRATVDRAVNGAFAKAFKSELQPVEIAAALQNEMDSRAAVVSRARTRGPQRVHRACEPGDYDRPSVLTKRWWASSR